MSSRKGGALTAEELVNTVAEAVKEKIERERVSEGNLDTNWLKGSEKKCDPTVWIIKGQ